MCATKAQLPPIPGSELVGRGVIIKPDAPYSPLGLLVPQDKWRDHHSPKTGATYSVPIALAIDESPPVPYRQALNKVVIEESFDRFETHFELDAKVAASGALFSIDATAGQTHHIRSEEDVYYALRSSFIALWSVFLPEPPKVDQAMWKDLPSRFSFDQRDTFREVFETYGTHYVQRAWVGGHAKLVLTVLKSSSLSKQDIQAGISASLGSATGSGNTASKENRERLQKNSNCTVWGKGGAEYELAALSKLDDAQYNDWLKTIRDNPMTIELEVKGIWTLIEDKQKREALMTAYDRETSAAPVTSGFILSEPSTDKKNPDGFTSVAYIIHQDKYISYDFNTNISSTPQHVIERWPELKNPELKFGWVDASFEMGGSLFMFSRTRFAAVTPDGKIDQNNPTRVGNIADGWEGLPFDRIDAAFSPNLNDVYFFSGDQYVRWDVSANRVADGYPQLISRRWFGVTFDRIDAVIYRPDTNKAYFFRGNQHIRYDLSIYRADAGYPKAVTSSYVQDLRL